MRNIFISLLALIFFSCDNEEHEPNSDSKITDTTNLDQYDLVALKVLITGDYDWGHDHVESVDVWYSNFPSRKFNIKVKGTNS